VTTPARIAQFDGVNLDAAMSTMEPTALLR
jgi:hypothetical protein